MREITQIALMQQGLHSRQGRGRYAKENICISRIVSHSLDKGLVLCFQTSIHPSIRPTYPYMADENWWTQIERYKTDKTVKTDKNRQNKWKHIKTDETMKTDKNNYKKVNTALNREKKQIERD